MRFVDATPTIKTQLAEAVLGGALGGAAGAASEEKDEETKEYKDKSFKRTRIGTGLGMMGGALGGQALRMKKLGLPFLAPSSVTPEQLQIIEKHNEGLHPFGIGLEAYKKASIAEYSVLFDAIDSGELGPHVKEALFGVCEGMSSSLQSHHAKVASESIEFSEADARQARLDQLLRRY